MSVDWFLKLKEFDSISKAKNALFKAKGEQEDRLSRLSEKRHEADLQSIKLKQELISTNGLLAETESKIKNATTQRQRLMDIGGDEGKIKAFTLEIENLENLGLDYLTRLDNLTTELEENKTFLNGIAKTIDEISIEVREEIEKFQKEIGHLNQRIELLREELPADFKNTLDKVTAKNLAHGPFTRIEQGSCYFCRFKISRIDESEIDMQKNLKTCPQCSRIFLPYGA